VTTTPSIV